MYSLRAPSAWILLVYGVFVSAPLCADDLLTDTPRKPPKTKKFVPTEPKTVSELFEAFTRGLTPDRRNPEQVRLFEMYRRSRFGNGNTSLPNNHNEKIAEFEEKHPDIQKPVFREVVYKKQEYSYPALSQLDNGGTVQSTWTSIQSVRSSLAPLLEVDRDALLKKGLTEDDLKFLYDQEDASWKSSPKDTKVEEMQKLFVGLIALRKHRKEPSKFLDQTLVNIANVAGFDHGLNRETLESNEPNSSEKLEALKRGIYHREDFVGDMRNFAPPDLVIEGGYKGLLELTGLQKASKFPGDTNLSKGIEALTKELEEKAELISSEPTRVRQMTPAEEALRSCVGGADCSSRTYLLTAKEADYIYFTETDTNHYSNGHITVVLGEANGEKVAMVDKIQNVQNADIPYFIESVRRSVKANGYTLGIPEDLGGHNGLSNYDFTRLFVGNELEAYTTSTRTAEGFRPHHEALTDATYSRAREGHKLRIVKPLDEKKRKQSRIRTGAKYEPVQMGNSIMKHIRSQVQAHKNSRNPADHFEYVHSVIAFLEGGVVIDKGFYSKFSRWMSDPNSPPQLKNTILRQVANLNSMVLNSKLTLLNSLAEELTEPEKRNLVQNWLQTPGLDRFILKLDELATLAPTVARYHPQDFINGFKRLSPPQMAAIGKNLEDELDSIPLMTRARAAAILTKKNGTNVYFSNSWDYAGEQKLFGVNSAHIHAVTLIDNSSDEDFGWKHYPQLLRLFNFGPADFLRELGELVGGDYLASVTRGAHLHKDSEKWPDGDAARAFLKRNPSQAAKKIEKQLKRQVYESEDGVKRAAPVLFDLSNAGLIDLWKDLPKMYSELPTGQRRSLVHHLARQRWPEGRERELLRFLANIDGHEAADYLKPNKPRPKLTQAEFNLFVYRLKGKEFGDETGDVLENLLKWAPPGFTNRPEFWHFIDSLCTGNVCTVGVLTALSHTIPKNKTFRERLKKLALAKGSDNLSEAALIQLTEIAPKSRDTVRTFQKVLKNGSHYLKNVAAELRPDLALRSPIKANRERAFHNIRPRDSGVLESTMQKALWFCFRRCPKQFADQARLHISTDFVLNKPPKAQRLYFQSLENYELEGHADNFDGNEDWKTATMHEVYLERGLRGDFQGDTKYILEKMIRADENDSANIEDYFKIATKHGQKQDTEAERMLIKYIVEYLSDYKDGGNEVPLKMYLALGRSEGNVFYHVDKNRKLLEHPSKEQSMELVKLLEDPVQRNAAARTLFLFESGDRDVAVAAARALLKAAIDPKEQLLNIYVGDVLKSIQKFKNDPEIDRILGQLVARYAAEGAPSYYLISVRNFLTNEHGTNSTAGPETAKACTAAACNPNHSLRTRFDALTIKHGLNGRSDQPTEQEKQAILDIFTDPEERKYTWQMLQSFHKDDPELVKRELLKHYLAIPDLDVFKELYDLGERSEAFEIAVANRLSQGHYDSQEMLYRLDGNWHQSWHTPRLHRAAAQVLLAKRQDNWRTAVSYLEKRQPTREVARIVAKAVGISPNYSIERLAHDWADKKTAKGGPVFGREIVPALLRGWENGVISQRFTAEAFERYFPKYAGLREAKRLNAIVQNTDIHFHARGAAAVALAQWESHQQRHRLPSVMTQETKDALRSRSSEHFTDAARIAGDFSPEAQVAMIEKDTEREQVERYFLQAKLAPEVRKAFLHRVAWGIFGDTLVTKARYSFGKKSDDVQGAMLLRAAHKHDPTPLGAVDYRRISDENLAHAGYLLVSDNEEVKNQGLRLLTLAPGQEREEARILAALEILNRPDDNYARNVLARNAIVQTVLKHNPSPEAIDKITKSLENNDGLRGHLLGLEKRDQFIARTARGESCRDMILGLAD